MPHPLSQLLVRDARAFGTALPTVAPRLRRSAPEPITARLGKGLLLLAEQALGVVQDIRSALPERIAERACPWKLRPFPAATVVAFEPTSDGTVVVPAHTEMKSRPVDGVRCTFRTTRSLPVGPYRVIRSELSLAPGRPTLFLVEFEATGATPLAEALGPELSLFIDGERELALGIVHAVTCSAMRVTWHSDAWDTRLEVPTDTLTRDGFQREEALAPDGEGIAHAFSVMTEAFLSPDKFRFVRIRNPLGERPKAQRATLVVQLGGDTQNSWRSQPLSIRAHAVPAVNLLEATAEPFELDLAARPAALRVSGLPADSGGVYAIREVHATDRDSLAPRRLPDARRLGANLSAPNAPATFATSLDRRDGSLRLHFLPRWGTPVEAGRYGVSAYVVACNRDHASKVRAGDLAGALTLEGCRLPFASVVPASPFVDRPKGVEFDVSVLAEAAVRRDSLGYLRSLVRTLALSFPAWGLPNERAEGVQQRLDALLDLEFRAARRKTSARSVQLGYGFRLVVNESAFFGRGDQGLFESALAEALARCVPATTFVELTVIGSKTGSETTYVKGMLA